MDDAVYARVMAEYDRYMCSLRYLSPSWREDTCWVMSSQWWYAAWTSPEISSRHMATARGTLLGFPVSMPSWAAEPRLVSHGSGAPGRLYARALSLGELMAR